MQWLYKALTGSPLGPLKHRPLAQVCLGGSNNHAWAGIYRAVPLFELLVLMMTAFELYEQARLAGDASPPLLLQVLCHNSFIYHILMSFTRMANIYIVSDGTSFTSFMRFDNIDGPSCYVHQS